MRFDAVGMGGGVFTDHYSSGQRCRLDLDGQCSWDTADLGVIPHISRALSNAL
jgi:hypothetical protein